MKLLLPCGPMICPSAFCTPTPYTGVSSDLNTFLIAIAATSAAIIAILGGLIFGRYLPAVNDRESGKARLKRLKNDLMEKKLQAIEKTASHNEMFPLYP